MTLSIPEGFAEVALRFRHTADPEPWVSTFGLALSTETDASDIASTVENAWGDTLNQKLSSDVTLFEIGITIGTADPAEHIVTNVPASTVGEGTNAVLPQNCALLLRKNTSLGGRQGKGRMFLPAMLDEGQVSPTGVITPGLVAALQPLASGFLNALGVEPLPPGIRMTLLHSVGTSHAGTPHNVNSLTVDSMIATQRRRLR